jgi:hypothetical protein
MNCDREPFFLSQDALTLRVRGDVVKALAFTLALLLVGCTNPLMQDPINGTWNLITAGGLSVSAAGSSGTLTISGGSTYTRSTAGAMAALQGYLGTEAGTITRSGSTYTFHSVSTTDYTLSWDGHTLSSSGNTQAVYGTVAHTYTK